MEIRRTNSDQEKATRVVDKIMEVAKKWLVPQALEDLPLIADPELVADARRLGMDDDGYIPVDNYGPDSELDADWIERIRAAFPEHA